MIPKSGNRLSETIMLKRKNLDNDPIELNRIIVWDGQARSFQAKIRRV
jgi:hypothetical protein